jgi:hypothetical protein
VENLVVILRQDQKMAKSPMQIDLSIKYLRNESVVLTISIEYNYCSEANSCSATQETRRMLEHNAVRVQPKQVRLFGAAVLSGCD